MENRNNNQKISLICFIYCCCLTVLGAAFIMLRPYLGNEKKGTELTLETQEHVSDTVEEAQAETGEELQDGYEEGLQEAATPNIDNDLVAYTDVENITHIFFHSLIVDTDKAFDGDVNAAGYNQVMTTIDEFMAIMEQMYERGYILVSIKDVVKRVVDEDGRESFVPGEIWIPEGKKPFVLSIDDVSYYEYMEGDGFASRLVLDEKGRPVCEMDLEDGSVVTGDFDVVPCLETFIEEHPDFAYNGARGILALTGYDGVLGYRTDPGYSGRADYQEQVAQAKEVAEGLKAYGWEFASHSYGHLNYGTISMENMQHDAQKWQDTVASIVGDTDIIIFPFGADIGDWTGYSGERFEYLYNMGFRYFCNVDSASSWLQIGDRYVRQGRRNLDGYRMYYDMIDDSVDWLSDLFDVREVFDNRRPVPVPQL